MDREHSPEIREAEVESRLETYLVFVRHGVAEKLVGSDTQDDIDAARSHTTEGDSQVYERGRALAAEIPLWPGDLIFKRSSHRLRAQQTADRTVQGFLDGQREKGVGINDDLGTRDPGKRSGLNFGNENITYTVGGRRRGTTKGLSEEWTRHPEIFQQDMKDSGLDDDANETLRGMERSFQNTIATIDRASSVFFKRWDKYGKEEKSVPPRMIIFMGSHGFVSEPWLKQVVGKYEREHNLKVPLELGYGENFLIHFPKNKREAAVLRIGGHNIPIENDFLQKFKVDTL